MDKTLPYFKVFMIREDLSDYPVYELPEGYSFALYRPGDEEAWADIEVSVGEFSDKKEALDYFNKEFGPYQDELKKRCIFVRDSSGELVATTSSWYGPFLSEKQMPRIHWVAVKPRHQGKGLAKALMTKAFEILNQIYDSKSVYIVTQTWSYKAINMYLDFGFKPYIGAVPRDGDDYDGDFETLNERAWQIIFDKLNLSHDQRKQFTEV